MQCRKLDGNAKAEDVLIRFIAVTTALISSARTIDRLFDPVNRTYVSRQTAEYCNIRYESIINESGVKMVSERMHTELQPFF